MTMVLLSSVNIVHSYWPNYVYPDLDKSRNDVSPFVFLRHKGDNHDTSKKATFAVTACSISFIRISAPTVDNLFATCF